VGFQAAQECPEQFMGQTYYVIGALGNIDENQATWELKFWWPDFSYLKQLREQNKPKHE
jgi:hypothetical protein